MKGNATWGRPWTPAEDALVRRIYPEGAAAVACVLPERTVGAIQARAKALGINRPKWTKADESRLEMLWGSKTLQELARIFKRTEWAIYSRSRALKLSGLPRGMEWMASAEARTGYHTKTLRKILAAAKVRIGTALTVDKAGRKSPRAFRRTFVDPFDVDEAIRRWQETETLSSAAERRGISPKVLRRLLDGRSGIPKRPAGKKCWRIPSEAIDRAVGAERRAA
jgi:hypothetical protein